MTVRGIHFGGQYPIKNDSFRHFPLTNGYHSRYLPSLLRHAFLECGSSYGTTTQDLEDHGNNYKTQWSIRAGGMMMDPNTSQGSTSDRTTEPENRDQPSGCRSGNRETIPSELSLLERQGLLQVLNDLKRSRSIAGEAERNANFERLKGIHRGQCIAYDIAYFGIVAQYPEVIEGGK